MTPIALHQRSSPQSSLVYLLGSRSCPDPLNKWRSSLLILQIQIAFFYGFDHTASSETGMNAPDKPPTWLRHHAAFSQHRSIKPVRPLYRVCRQLQAHFFQDQRDTITNCRVGANDRSTIPKGTCNRSEAI